MTQFDVLYSLDGVYGPLYVFYDECFTMTTRIQYGTFDPPRHMTTRYESLSILSEYYNE